MESTMHKSSCKNQITIKDVPSSPAKPALRPSNHIRPISFIMGMYVEVVYTPPELRGEGVWARAHSIPGLDLRREDHRLRTMALWPARIMVDHEKAAKYGLYYAGTDDLLKCVFCDVRIHSWLSEDDPLVDHEKWSENCPLLKRRPVGNVPLHPGRDECGPSETRPRPSHPAFRTEAARLASFTNWPAHMRQTPAELADAGFYYTGQGDHTTCFYCGRGLKDWEDGDLPWEQHAMWFKLCPYLLAVKSERYVFEVKQRLSGAESSPLSKPAPTVVTLKNDRSNDDSKVCGICCVGERNICIIPCGHVFTCVMCTLSIKTCLICRGLINNIQRFYYS